MLKIIRTGRFIRDLKKAIKAHKDINKLQNVIDILQTKGTLPAKYVQKPNFIQHMR